MRFVLPSIALYALTLAAAAPAYADDCAGIVSASIKQTAIPYSGNMTITQAGGQPLKGTSIYMVTKLYTQVNGKWNVMPINAAQMTQQIQASMKSGNMSCKKMGSESVGGEAATIYSAHDVQGGNTIDTKSWISNSRNLPLKSEAHIASGTGGGQSISMTFNYTNVSAPAGVK